MRLICPNCSAQYDVDGSMIPDAGRDVQCSNCGHGWFQHPEDGAKTESLAESARRETELDPAPELETDVEPTPPPDPESTPEPTPEKQRLDPTVTDVLRAEAERETAQRRAETHEPIESQPDLGLDEAESAATRTDGAKARMARLRGLDEAAELEANSVARSRDLLPDVEEINSTLRGKSQTPPPVAMPEIGGSVDAPRGGFRFGFYLVLLLAIIAVLVYAFAPQIIEMVPALESSLTGYVEAVNGLRAQINGLIESGIAWIRNLSSSIGG